MHIGSSSQQTICIQFRTLSYKRATTCPVMTLHLTYLSIITDDRLTICHACNTSHHHHYHQPINVPTAGARAFLMDYPQGERAITHHAGPVRIGGC
jgi:hypothetical protein